MNMKKIVLYFGNYLSGIAAIVAALPLALTNFGAFPLPRGAFAPVFVYMCTVADYLIIGIVIFFLDRFKVYLFPDAGNIAHGSRAGRWVRATPITVLVIFLLSSFLYIMNNEKFREDILAANGFVLSWTAAVCLLALTIMFIAPVVALSIMGAKNAILNEEKRDSENH